MTRTLCLVLGLAAASAAVAAADEPTPAADQAAPPGAADGEAARPQWGRGLLEIRDPYVLALQRLSPWARSPETLGHLEVQVGLRVWNANSYAFNRNRHVIDGEVRQFMPYVRVGLLDRLELSLYVPYQWRGGGEMDGFIEDFHEAFGIPNADRDDSPRNQYLVTGFEKDQTPFVLEHSGYGFSDLVAEARVLLTAGGEGLPAAAAGIRLRLPTGRGKFDLADGVDATLSLDASKRLGDPFVLYTGLAYTYYGEARLEGLELMRHRVFFYLGGELELTSWLSLAVHAWIESRRERKLWADAATFDPATYRRADPDFGNWVTYVMIGFKAEATDGLVFEVGVLENIVDPEITADFTVAFNVHWTFGGADPDESAAPLE